jgi:hypothetical protein
LQDRAKEMHEDRKKQTGGEDKIREKFLESSKKSRRGKVYDDND